MKRIAVIGTIVFACAFANVSEAAITNGTDTRRRFINAARAQEVTRAMHAKIAITANTAPKKAARVRLQTMILKT